LCSDVLDAEVPVQSFGNPATLRLFDGVAIRERIEYQHHLALPAILLVLKKIQ
jgi:hypothetical protein